MKIEWKIKKMQLKIIKIIFTNFSIKEMCWWNPWELPVELGSTEHSLSIARLGKYRESNIV
jgi:hypothetical protein